MNDKVNSAKIEKARSQVSRKAETRRRATPPDVYQVVVTCRDENEQKRLFQRLRKKYRVRLLVL